MSPRATGWSRALATTGAVVAIDQVTKAWVVSEIPRGEERNVFFLLDLTNVRNEG
ncbi:MAG: hypothetical protein H0T15_08865, partial [Thermoleophilaceae bacterium]|nr:hypothetical protein [Thermoleophilaceae bacterium]